MNNKDYWTKRFLLEMDEIYKSNTSDILKEVMNIYLLTQKDILKELLALRAYNKANNITAISREIMLQETLNNVNNSISLLADNTNNLLTKNLTNTYIQTYETVTDNLKKIGITAKDIIPANVESIIKDKWNGLSYSDRIWHNRDVLIYNAKDIISKGLIRGSSYHDMSVELSNKMNGSYSNSRRLIETEISASQNKANIDNYKNNDIEKVEISAILDSKCCSKCREHDGKIISIDKIEVYDVISHPSCRCCCVPVIDID